MLPIPNEHIDFGVLLELCQKAMNLPQRNAQIGIHVEDDLARGAQHPAPHRVPLSPLGPIVHNLKAHRRIGLLSSHLSRYSQRPVWALLDDDQHLQSSLELFREPPQFHHRRRQSHRFPIGWDDYGKVWRHLIAG